MQTRKAHARCMGSIDGQPIWEITHPDSTFRITTTKPVATAVAFIYLHVLKNSVEYDSDRSNTHS